MAKELDIVAVHEAGHFAAVAAICGPDMVSTMRIRSDGSGYLRNYITDSTERNRPYICIAGPVFEMLHLDALWNDKPVGWAGDISNYLGCEHFITESEIEYILDTADEEHLEKAMRMADDTLAPLFGPHVNYDKLVAVIAVAVQIFYMDGSKEFVEKVVSETRKGRQQWGRKLCSELATYHYGR